MNASDAKYLREAQGVLATGSIEDVLLYAERLRDLEGFGMTEDLRRLKNLAKKLEAAEKARLAASKKFHDAAERILSDCLKHWTHAEVMISLFGSRFGD